MCNTGITTQSDDSILEDIEEFYFAGSAPWIRNAQRAIDELPRTLLTMWDPNAEEDTTLKSYTVTADEIRAAFVTAQERGYHLCCAADIQSERLGYGCADDLNLILQTAAYGELVFS